MQKRNWEVLSGILPKILKCNYILKQYLLKTSSQTCGRLWVKCSVNLSGVKKMWVPLDCEPSPVVNEVAGLNMGPKLHTVHVNIKNMAIVKVPKVENLVLVLSLQGQLYMDVY
jgi:hypothetical protein